MSQHEWFSFHPYVRNLIVIALREKREKMKFDAVFQAVQMTGMIGEMGAGMGELLPEGMHAAITAPVVEGVNHAAEAVDAAFEAAIARLELPR